MHLRVKGIGCIIDETLATFMKQLSLFDLTEVKMSIHKPPEKVKALLWAKSAGRCEFNGCNEPLWRDGLTQIEMNFGEVAHIIGDRPGGPRGDVVLSDAYCKDITNLMLMCHTHHKMIDEIYKQYSEDDLHQMKQDHESRIELLTGIKTEKTSHILFYKGRVGDCQPKIQLADAWNAIVPNWYPSGPIPIELGMGNTAYHDDEKDFWKIEEENLVRQFKEQVQPIITRKEFQNHFSVFAFAPQPLLMKLGSLIPDIYPAEVYQLHREPSNWVWQPDLEDIEYQVIEPSSSHRIVALVLSLSATIDSPRIKTVFGKNPYSEWRMSISNPNNDFLKSRSQLVLFRQEFRRLLDRIKAKHGDDAEIHVFAAVPISVAEEIGRIRQPKADLPFVIYDQNNKSGGFVQAITIGERKNG